MQLEPQEPFATPQPKPRIPAHFTRKSLLGASGLIAFMLAMFLVPAGINYWLWMHSTWPWWGCLAASLPLFVIAGQGVHLMGWVAHDGFHLTFHSNPRVSAVIALFFSSMTLVFYESGMAIDHWSHHRFANTEHDPDLRLLRRYRTFWGRMFGQRNRANAHYFRRALHLALGRPLPPEISNVRLPFRPPVMRALAVLNLLFALGWLLTYLHVETLLPGSIWICVAVPLVVSGWLSGLRSFTEHAHTGVGDLHNTRSRTHWLFTLIDYGGNYHLEHHLYPSVPQWRLPALHRWLVQHGFYDRLPDPSVIDPHLSVYRYTLARYEYGRKSSAPRETAVPSPVHP
ncbi:fatty acid desaturase [Ramlibacter sp.]|uniref:fatty acid desaturase family protein n=1 Tax=Ramlibacter sp. TaxID=1917967 RepID=UPI00262A9842|nr:fatty acid desaturase [Ramlibacter sp.]MDB5956948.1 fatty acid desaturase [Ramlibacter sp.]